MSNKPTFGAGIMTSIIKILLIGVSLLSFLLTLIIVPVKYPDLIPTEVGAYLEHWTARAIFIPDKMLVGMLNMELPSQAELSPYSDQVPEASTTAVETNSASLPVQEAKQQGEEKELRISKLSPAGSPEASTLWVQLLKKGVVRNEAKETSPEIMVIPAGEWLPVVKQEKQWTKVKLGASQTGWLQGGEVQMHKLSDPTQILRVASQTPLYSGPDYSFEKLGIAEEGSSYVPKQVSGQWIELKEKKFQSSLWVPAEQVVWTYGQPNAAVAASVSISASSRKEALGKLAGKTIVLDPGHGGKDTGAIAQIKKVYERDVNLSVAIVLKNKLLAAGAQVIMTRTTNEETVSLESRADISNRNHADLFISIHQNAFVEDPTVAGAITFYSNENSLKAAQLIEEGINDSIGGENTRHRVEKQPFVVLRQNKQPAVLVEGCFLSNPEELANSLLSTFHEQLAVGIYNGALKFLEADA
ncbi:N-acetylmuramoyl-L-alanine amidase [Paenibacillus sp. YN15]|uniref:N-acetylmuramoyl-L-alanine amidase n=1 Tax=Paenibacillus sp. YN15 TaxID=1742774 RepID=UPI000DCEADA5|nr:N-acetylmuramoyl-L-alanine amidase [Paenibacillus sp. YN15]RAV04973.1 hypothetical protein DQG13_03595 [Paenibacillus sp. YN15]